MKQIPSEFRCPTCATALSPNALSCGRCGAQRDGAVWLAPHACDGLDLSDDEFDYDDFVRREFGTDRGEGNRVTRLNPRERFWWVVAVVLLVILLLGYSIGF